MHQIIERELEDYLGGSGSREFESHLAQCRGCHEEVQSMRRLSGMLGALRTNAPMDPPLGFGARVGRTVQDQRRRSLWGLFSIDPSFARRFAFASLLGLAVLGGYLATEPGDAMAQADQTPEAVMGSHDASASDSQQHLDGMLITLAHYHQ